MKSDNPGFGGYWPGNPDAKKYNVTIMLPKSADGSQKPALSLMVPEDRYIYFYFEEMGISLPFFNAQRMCRQGCCTICTAKVLNSKPNEIEEPFNNKAKVKMDSPLGLLKQFRYTNTEVKPSKAGDEINPELLSRFVLTCCTCPRSDMLLQLQGEDEMYIRQWSEGFEGGGVQWGGFLPDDD
eukprot:CAMPEP_0170070194 /NCGR_PEP_ID=MMETSP0019_2-20121128/8583_1 /TAXON_ID=98059 /ORGANISM="Dinobryon sp., Strain UTEXLB2267" /LENGTH=181 /DNA_ID=CAMNT_0010278423 /DNA_START=1910 /DNA_END=2455 /DNA_ORIENTATION=+